MADIAYIRETREGPSIDDQKVAVRPSFCSCFSVYVDTAPVKRVHRSTGAKQLTQRQAALRDLQPGSKLIVSSLDRLGVSAGDIRHVLDILFETNRAVFCVATSQMLDATTPRLSVSENALAAEKVLKQERIKKARSVLPDLPAKVSARRRDLPPEQMAVAELKWRSDFALSTHDLAAEFDRSTSWFHRRFGPRTCSM